MADMEQVRRKTRQWTLTGVGVVVGAVVVDMVFGTTGLVVAAVGAGAVGGVAWRRKRSHSTSPDGND